jgi:hypothetical protein
MAGRAPNRRGQAGAAGAAEEEHKDGDEMEQGVLGEERSARTSEKIRLLKGEIYKEWRVSALVFFSTLGLSDVVAGLDGDEYEIKAVVGQGAAVVDGKRLIKESQSKAVFGHLVRATELSFKPGFTLLTNVMDDKGMDGRAGWFALERSLSARTKLSWKDVRRDLGVSEDYRQKEDEKAVDYADRVRVLVNKLTQLTANKGFTEEFSAMLFLGGLLPKFESRVMTIDTSYDKLELDVALSLVRDYEGICKSNSSKEKKMTPQVNQIQVNNGTCFRCGESGHRKANCPKAKKWQGESASSSRPVCSHCKLSNHTEDRCWKKYPNLKKSYKTANANMVQVESAGLVSQRKEPYLAVVLHGLAKEETEVNFAEALKSKAKVVEANYSSAKSRESKPQEFYLDSAASASMGCVSLALENRQLAPEMRIRTASKQVLQAPSKGDLKLKTRSGAPLVLQGVLSHQQLRNNLISIHQLTGNPAVKSVCFDHFKAQVIGHDNGVLLEGVVRDGMYVIQTNHRGSYHHVCAVQVLDKNETQLWHSRLGHRHIGALDKLQRSGLVDGFKELKFTIDPSDPCVSCIKGKAHRAKFGKSVDGQYKLDEAGQQLVSDVFGPLAESYDGMHYGQVIVDAVASHVTVKFYATKHAVIQGSQDHLTAMEVKFGSPVKEFHTDGGSEFTSNSFQRYCRTKGIRQTITVPHTPQHDGMSERMIRTLFDMARSLMFHAGAPRFLWTDALQEAAYVYNHTKIVDGFNKTPYQIYEKHTGPINLTGLRVWGCDAWKTTSQDERASKFDSRARLMIYLGHSDFYRSGYKLLDVERMKIEHNRDVTFIEKQFTQARELRDAVIDSADPSEDDPDFLKWLGDKTDRNELELVKRISLEATQQKRNNPVVADAPIQRGRGRPRGGDGAKKPASAPIKTKMKVNITVADPQSNEPPTRRSTRSTTTPSRYGMVDVNDIGQALQAQVESKEQEEAREERRLKDRAAAHENVDIDPALPRPNRKGEIKMPSQRCTADNKKGKQCGSRTCNGEYCWNHLLSVNGLRIKNSTILRAGRGLFAARDFPRGTEVTMYTGDNVPGNADNYDGSEYVFELSLRSAIDAARTNTAPGRMINDATGSGKKTNNCTWLVNRRNKTVRLTATRLVKKGEEFFVSYGPNYWPLRKRLGAGPKKIAAAHAVTANRIEVFDGDIAIPQNYNQAISCAERHNWIPAIESELNSLALSGTWALVNEIPSDRKKISTKWVFSVKRDSNGNVVRYKARLVVRGFSQIKDQDYNETFAPVLDTRSLRLMLALVAYYDLECKQFDVETAFLNATLEEEIYIEIPQGLSHSSNHVAARLLKSLYGLKQASHEWNKLFVKAITDLGYSQLKYADDCMFLKMSKTRKPIIISIFVDDGINSCHSDDLKELGADMNQLMSKFKIKDLGDIKLILGMRVQRDRNGGRLTLDQTSYVERLLKEWGFDDCKPVETPELSAASQAAFEKNASAMSKRDPMHHSGKLSLENYGSIVGALNYLALATRPDIAHAVNMLARDLVKPMPASLLAVKRVLRYLKGTMDLPIRFRAQKQVTAKLDAFSDADWAGEVESAKSTSGMITKLGDGPISWSSKKQTIVALSSTEAEYIALCEAAREVVWLKYLLSQLRLTQNEDSKAVLINVDNQTAIRMAQDDGNNARRKHINVKYHWTRELIQQGSIYVKWIQTELQQADIFTKAVPQPAFGKLRDLVMGLTDA